MTQPNDIGSVWVDVHANTDRVDDEIVAGVTRESNKAEKELNALGQDLGEALTEGMAKEIEKNAGPAIGESVEKSISREKVDFNPDWRYSTRGRNGRFVKRMVSSIEEEVEEAFNASGSLGGKLFAKVGEAVSDAIGAGFNISGGSPLVAFLIPVIGAIVGLVLAAIQAVNALIAVLTAVPALLTAVGLQAGVLILAFKGVGTAIQGAFAATNAKELNEAIKGLTPSAQAFVKSLLPLEKLFTDLKAISQQNFFKALGADLVPRIQKSLGPTFLTGFATLATALGGLFRDIGLFFASPSFNAFIKSVIPATVRWLDKFGPAFVMFLTGLIAMADAAVPFLEVLGGMLNELLVNLGGDLFDIGKSKEFGQWLKDMETTLRSIGGLISSVTAFVVSFMSTLNEAGGNTVIDKLAEAFDILALYFATDFGKKSLEGLVDIAKISIEAVAGLIIFIAALFGLLEITGEFINLELWPAIKAAGTAVGEFFVWLWNNIAGFFVGIGETVSNWVNGLKALFYSLWAGVTAGVGTVLAAVTSLPGKVLAALGNIGNLLWGKGRDLVQGFINGIQSMFGALGNTASALITRITNVLPGSPAEEGPLSGQGYVYLRGQRMVGDFAAGMERESTNLLNSSLEAMNNVVFGQNSIQIRFQGALPTDDQARSTGAQVANGMSSILAARNTRLAVRTI